MREIDRLTIDEHQVPSLLLMENAGKAVANVIIDSLSGKVAGNSILTLCGPGNNGGDGAVAARRLALLGAKVQVVLFGKLKEAKGDARANFEVVRGLANGEEHLSETFVDQIFEPPHFANPQPLIEFTECTTAGEWDKLLSFLVQEPPPIIIDAIFGTGLRRPLTGIHQEAVRFLSCLKEKHPPQCFIVSVDIPSGLNSDLAEPIGETVTADVTVTMSAPKPANVLPLASILNGRLIVADIGSPFELIEQTNPQLFVTEERDARDWLVRTRYRPDSYKTVHGHVLVIAGSRGFTGAAALCGAAALRSGAGLVTIATPVSAQATVAAVALPEIMTAALPETDRGAVSIEGLEYALGLAASASVVAIGPGLSTGDERTRDFVRSFIERRRFPVVVDADGLNALAPWPTGLQGSQKFPLILTPHPGEMLRLMGTSDKSALSDRVVAARDFATGHQVIVVLKGTRSLIAAPDGRVFVNPTGNAGLGTAGCGDTLTGLISGFLAQAAKPADQNGSINALDTVIAALFVGGLAGDLTAKSLGMRAMLASDVRDHFSAAIRSLDPEGELP
ncbi:MAG: ADP-dependent NAD(P)H-hydrate dehydratase / NAD(P)H-hydrate epimerase [Blastocatellia bacterium]|jgi:NAD(P)H-hydrate epimerase|nr:ADP-dependent NAD(P)H-hydrate dehydratase / NAD(P)H-hydrate epimerase [Blastocatellia bacterium]